MAVTSGQFSITFDKVNGVFILEDTTDYAGQSKPLTDVYGNFKIISPAGLTIHNNISPTTPDIDADVSLINNTIPLPLDSNGEVLCGAYSFTYSITDTSDNSVTVVTSAISYVYKSPEVEIRMSYDCAKPELISEDETNYLVDGVLPTTSVFNHNLYYPPTTGASTINAAADLITTNVFYTLKNVGLQHSSDLTVDLTYDFTSYSVIDQITGNEFIDVICDPGLCDIFCGLYSLWNKYIETKGSKCSNEYLDKFVRLMSASAFVKQAYSCGQSDKVPAIIEEIKLQGNFADECCCDDDSTAPILVTGVGASSNSVVSPGTGIIVSTVTAGTTTTYTVSVDPVVLSNILNITTSIVASGLSTTITPVTVGNTTTYTVDVNYNLTDNIIPVYNSTSQELEDTNLAWDGTELTNSGDLEFTKVNGSTKYKIHQDSLVGGDLPEGNITETEDASYNHRVVNGEWVATGDKGSGFDLMTAAGSLKGWYRLVESMGAFKISSYLEDPAIVSNYSKEVTGQSSVEEVISATATSTVTIEDDNVTHNSPLVRVDDARALTGSNYFQVDEAITVEKQALGTAIAIGSNTTPGDYTSTVIGDSANVSTNTNAVAIGYNSYAETDSVSINGGSFGTDSVSINGGAGTSSIAIGNNATGANSIRIGVGAGTFSVDYNIGIGYKATGVTNAITIGNGTLVANLFNSETKSLLVGFGNTVADKLLHIGRTKAQNYLGGTGTFEFSNQDSGLVQNSKWNFHDGDVEVVNPGSGFIVKSPDNTRWRVTVSNAGAISIAAA